MEEGFDYDGHRAWFARELRHEPNPRRLFQDAFNDVPVEAIPRDAALRMIQFFLSAREPAEFPDGTYPVEVTRTSERLLRSFERPPHNLRFRSEFVVDLGPGAGGGEVTVRSPIPAEAETQLSKSIDGDRRTHPAMTSFLTGTANVATGGVETDASLSRDVDFIRPNKFALSGWYKPLIMQALIAATRWYGSHRLHAAGFTRTHDEKTGCDVWSRPRVAEKGDGLNPEDPNRHDPVVFLHGLGVGLSPYADYVADFLPRDRPVLAPEWPNISYGWNDRCHRYPTPREFAAFLARAVTETHARSVRKEWEETSYEEAARFTKVEVGADGRAVGEPGGGGIDSASGRPPIANVGFKCDLVAHSYGTVILTAFRKHEGRLVRRCVYVDPVCFLPSFGSYLRYAHDDHLRSTYDLLTHLAARGADPHEPMSMANLVLASWFVKGEFIFIFVWAIRMTWFFVKGDPSTQQLMKRLLFPHEAWERGPLGANDMVVLSGLDDIVASAEIAERFARAWPLCEVVTQPQWQHGGFLLEPDPDGVNARIVRFVEGGRSDDDARDDDKGHKRRRRARGGDEGEGAVRGGLARGAIRRAWRLASRKSRKSREKIGAEKGGAAAATAAAEDGDGDGEKVGGVTARAAVPLAATA